MCKSGPASGALSGNGTAIGTGEDGLESVKDLGAGERKDGLSAGCIEGDNVLCSGLNAESRRFWATLFFSSLISCNRPDIVLSKCCFTWSSSVRQGQSRRKDNRLLTVNVQAQ